MKISSIHLKNIGFIWTFTLVVSVLGFVNQYLLTRIFSIDDYGLFSSVNAFINLLMPFAVFGIPSLWLKIFGEYGGGGRSWILPSLKVSLILASISIIITCTWAFLGPNDYLTKKTLITLSFLYPINILINFVCSKTQLEEKYLLYSFFTALLKLSRFLIILILFFFANEIKPPNLAFLYVFGGLIILIGLRRHIKQLFRSEIFLPKHPLKLNTIKSGVTMVTVAKESWSFGLAGVLYLAWSQGHIIISKYKFGNTEAGIYSIVILIMMAINIFPTTLFSRYLLPKIHKYSYHNKKKLINIYNKSNLILFTVGVIVGFLIYKSSDFFINFMFDENYSSSIQLLKLSSFIIPFRFMGLNSGTLMTTGNFLLIKNKALFIVAFLNLTIAILMPKEYGLKGLIILILISEFILFTFYHIYIKYNFIKHE